MKYCFLTTVIVLITFFLNTWANAQSVEEPVRIWEEKTVLPTYLVDPPDLNPRFYDGRAYQGAQGRVYPYPIYESLSETRVEKEYTMVYLENEYIKIEVLPEIGGRLFGAVDKTNGYVYVYKQHVVKPGLIGMLGAWISGGIEWNFPHHHRATTFMPVEYQMEENEDGSATVWISELEIRHRMKFNLGITVFPGKTYFEVTFKPINRTPLVNSFLYFANTGVHTSEDYQVIFPPNTKYGTYHGKNQFVPWPISHEIYNQVDYTDGVDISWWKNHPEWTSIFAWNYQDDFIAGYDHGKKAGTLLYSNHHIGAGKKFWTWSTGPRGQLWDKALTEMDGPELELMIGGYSDNQPDYSWMQPFESKFLRQYWYPIRNIGGVKIANLEAAANLKFSNPNEITLAFNTTSKYNDAESMVLVKDRTVFLKKIDIDPEHPFSHTITISDPYEHSDVRICLISQDGDTLIAYQPRIKRQTKLPQTAKPPLQPSEIETVEELFLAGLRLEQFYNPLLDPFAYYEEALERDPGNYRVNIAVGISYLKNGMFKEAESNFKTAVNRITVNHTKPRDGEGYYYLGLAQKYQEKFGEAYKNLYQATWSNAFHSAAYYLLAEIDCLNQKFDLALAHLDRSLSTNANNTKALNLKTAVLRILDQKEDAAVLNNKVREEHPLDFWSLFESYLGAEILGNSETQSLTFPGIEEKMGDYVENYLELSLDYGNCGLWMEAINVLEMIDSSKGDTGSVYPMIYYYLAWYHAKIKDQKGVDDYLKLAGKMPTDFCFPFRLESIEVLNFAIENNPKDAKAHYLLGNLLYEKQPEKAIPCWEKSRELDDSFPTVHRNLGWGYYKFQNDISQAISSYEKAVSLDPNDQRVLYELDLAYADYRVSPEKRLKILMENHNAIADNNVTDALAREVMLLVQLGRYDEALEMAENNYFRQWEGVSKAYGSYVDAHLLRGQQNYRSGVFGEALQDYLSAREFPDNMMVAETYRGGRLGQVYYFIGTAYEALNESKKAIDYYTLAANRRERTTLSENHYYKALAMNKLGMENEATAIFDGLVSLGKKQLEQTEVDFFAKFGEKQTPSDKKADAYYLLGLGYLGIGMVEEASQELGNAVRLNINHIWAAALAKQMK